MILILAFIKYNASKIPFLVGLRLILFIFKWEFLFISAAIIKKEDYSLMIHIQEIIIGGKDLPMDQMVKKFFQVYFGFIIIIIHIGGKQVDIWGKVYIWVKLIYIKRKKNEDKH